MGIAGAGLAPGLFPGLPQLLEPVVIPLHHGVIVLLGAFDVYLVLLEPVGLTFRLVVRSHFLPFEFSLLIFVVGFKFVDRPRLPVSHFILLLRGFGVEVFYSVEQFVLSFLITLSWLLRLLCVILLCRVS